MSITQSEVGNDFFMPVPIFADCGKGFVRLGQLPVNSGALKGAAIGE